MNVATAFIGAKCVGELRESDPTDRIDVKLHAGNPFFCCLAFRTDLYSDHSFRPFNRSVRDVLIRRRASIRFASTTCEGVMKAMLRAITCSLILVLAGAIDARAQGFQGGIRGAVKDAGGV